MISSEAPVKLSRNEGLKEANPLLAGTIAEALQDAAAERFTDDDYEFLKFHGVYQQDDRDKRKTAKQYVMMIRTKFPGGTLTPQQYLVCDDLATRLANNTLRITTRQDFQFHGVLKSNLRQTIKSLNEALISTLAACGDVNRNVVAPPTPATSPLVEQVLEHARNLSGKLAPQTSAYHSIWLEGQELKLNPESAGSFVDPLYGKTYLPRKFKVAFAIPPRNDVDIFTNDLGFVAIEQNGKLAGFNLLAGGGLGMSQGNAPTLPSLGGCIGFFTD